MDGFVARVKADGSGLVYAGYIGGSGTDTIDDVALDFSGNAYVVGTTNSTQASLPVLGGPDLTYNGGVFDTFVAKVNAAGTALVYCGYIGGAADDRGTGIAVDFGGNAYVTGFTSSNNLPVAVGPDLTYNGGFDAFVAKVNNTGSGLVYCGYLGGSNSEQALGIAWHFSGTVKVARRRHHGLDGDDDSKRVPGRRGPRPHLQRRPQGRLHRAGQCGWQRSELLRIHRRNCDRRRDCRGRRLQQHRLRHGADELHSGELPGSRGA